MKYTVAYMRVGVLMVSQAGALTWCFVVFFRKLTKKHLLKVEKSFPYKNQNLQKY